MFEAIGDRGRLLARYAEAGRLGAWECVSGDTLGPTQTRISAVVEWLHPTLQHFSPLTIALEFSGVEWRWTAVRSELIDGQLTVIAFGAPIIETVGAGHGV